MLLFILIVMKERGKKLAIRHREKEGQYNKQERKKEKTSQYVREERKVNISRKKEHSIC